MADDKPEKGKENEEPEKGSENGKGDAGDLDPKVAGLMNNPDGIKKVLDALNKANKEAENRRLKAAADEKKAMEEQGKFKELSERKDAELTALKDAFTKRTADAAIKIEAVAAGAVNADHVVALASREGIKVGDDFIVQGAKEAVAALKKDAAHLFGEPGKKIPPPGTKPPASGEGTSAGFDITKMSARELIEKGLAKK